MKRSHFLNLFAAISLLALVTGNIPLFMLGFVAAATLAPRNSYLLNTCVTSCELNDITSAIGCNTRGGIRVVYWINYTEVDWDAMAISPAHFDAANYTILDYIMIGGATFRKLTFDSKTSFYEFIYTEDTGVYTQLITMIFEGKSAPNTLAFCNAVGCCNVVAHIFDNNCLARVVGPSWTGSVIGNQTKTLRIGRHGDYSGVFGDSIARDELDLTGESICPPLFSTIDELAIP